MQKKVENYDFHNIFAPVAFPAETAVILIPAPLAKFQFLVTSILVNL